MVQRFIKDIGGTLSLANKHPHGACVSIWLPKDCMVER
jgi:two-component system NtrC family sensor kinase